MGQLSSPNGQLGKGRGCPGHQWPDPALGAAPLPRRNAPPPTCPRHAGIHPDPDFIRDSVIFFNSLSGHFRGLPVGKFFGFNLKAPLLKR